MTFDPIKLVERLQVRIWLEGAAVADAVHCISAEMLGKMEAVLVAWTQKAAAGGDTSPEDPRYHQLLYSGLRSESLTRLIDIFWFIYHAQTVDLALRATPRFVTHLIVRRVIIRNCDYRQRQRPGVCFRALPRPWRDAACQGEHELEETRFDHGSVIRAMVGELAGDVDPDGVEIMRLVRMVNRAYEAHVDDALRESGLSGPRWGLLLRMYAEEQRGANGMSPTHLSRCQNVSKNTISSLIGGLEEQGLVERELDRADKRVFRIYLTDAGRQAVEDTAPDHVVYLNALAAGLSAEERDQLIALLEKLHASLRSHGA